MSERKRRKPRHPGKEPRVTRDSLARYIAYPEAMKLLRQRLPNVTPDELAAWVFAGTKADALEQLSFRKKWKQTPLELESDMKELEDLNRMGPKDYGLAAYPNANELPSPPRFRYDFCSENDLDYLSPLMACWFWANDIATFEPVRRYITGKVLIERWSKQPDIQPEAFIRAKIAESRLFGFNPNRGLIQGPNSQDPSSPPVASGLFALSAVKDIEAEDFGVNEVDDGKRSNMSHPQGETPPQRKKRLWQRHDELKATGVRDPTQQVANEEGVSASRIRQLIGLGKDQHLGSSSNDIFGNRKTGTRKPPR